MSLLPRLLSSLFSSSVPVSLPLAPSLSPSLPLCLRFALHFWLIAVTRLPMLEILHLPSAAFYTPFSLPLLPPSLPLLPSFRPLLPSLFMHSFIRAFYTCSCRGLLIMTGIFISFAAAQISTAIPSSLFSSLSHILSLSPSLLWVHFGWAIKFAFI